MARVPLAVKTGRLSRGSLLACRRATTTAVEPSSSWARRPIRASTARIGTTPGAADRANRWPHRPSRSRNGWCKHRELGSRAERSTVMARSDEKPDAEQRMLGTVPGEALGRGQAPNGDYSRHEYHHPAAGWGAARSVGNVLRRAGEPVEGFRALFA